MAQRTVLVSSVEGLAAHHHEVCTQGPTSLPGNHRALHSRRMNDITTKKRRAASYQEHLAFALIDSPSDGNCNQLGRGRLPHTL